MIWNFVGTFKFKNVNKCNQFKNQLCKQCRTVKKLKIVLLVKDPNKYYFYKMIITTFDREQLLHILHVLNLDILFTIRYVVEGGKILHFCFSIFIQIILNLISYRISLFYKNHRVLLNNILVIKLLENVSDFKTAWLDFWFKLTIPEVHVFWNIFLSVTNIITFIYVREGRIRSHRK